MKNRIVLVAALLVLFLLPLSVSAKPSKATVTKSYTTYRKKEGITRYKLVDIDNNGIQEMIYYRRFQCGFCTYDAKKKNVLPLAEVEVGHSIPFAYYSTKKHTVILYTLTTKTSDTFEYLLSGKKISLQTHLVYDNTERGGAKYYINGKKVSQKKNAKWWNKVKKTYTKVSF